MFNKLLEWSSVTRQINVNVIPSGATGKTIRDEDGSGNTLGLIHLSGKRGATIALFYIDFPLSLKSMCCFKSNLYSV